MIYNYPPKKTQLNNSGFFHLKRIWLSRQDAEEEREDGSEEI